MQITTSRPGSALQPLQHAALSGDVAVSGAPMPREFLSFRLGQEEYGIDILRVQEIRSYEQPTRIANAPPFIKGVLNLRGLVVPIVDLRMCLGCADATYDALTVVIVLNVRDRIIGAVVDSVSDVITLDRGAIKPAPAMSTAVDASFILGLGCIASGDVERLLILTDIERLMGRPAMGLFDMAVESLAAPADCLVQ